MISSYFSNTLIEAVGTTLINSIWQGLVLAALLSLILYAIPKNRVELKYWLSVTALTAVLFWTGYTFVQQVIPLSHPGSAQYADGMLLDLSGSALSLKDSGLIATFKGQMNLWLSVIHPYMDNIVLIWLAGVVLFLVRLQGSMIYLRRLKVIGTQPVSLGWEQRVGRLSAKLGIRKKVEVLESSLAGIPMVIGHLKPVLLLPAGMLTGLSVREIESILVHELAHIKRFDYLINIMQTVVESFLFFNPAVWWISQSIRKHREHCCDDIAVKYCGNQLEYANALSNLGAWSLNTPALGMGLFKNKNELLMRIRRLVYPQVRSRTLKEKLIPGLVLLVTLTCLSWYSLRVQAQLIPVEKIDASIISTTQQSTGLVNDTIPHNEEQEVLPPMEPDLVPDTEWPLDQELDLDIEVEVPLELSEIQHVYDMDLIVIPDIEEAVELSLAVVPDVDVPEVDIEIDELVQLDQLQQAMADLNVHFNDTTRERIREALEAQREALERARIEQSEALEKAREQLRKSLEADRPEDLTEEEWEMAKQQIARAERSIEQAMRQSERALAHAMQEQDQHLHRDIERAIRESNVKRERIHIHREQVERERARIHRDLDRAEKIARANRVARVYGAERAEAWRHYAHNGREAELREALVEDGLIDSYRSDIQLSFTKDSVKINGVKLQGTQKDKYRKLLDSIYGENSKGEISFSMD